MIPFPSKRYTEALANERLVRDAAFLPVGEFIADFQVVPMNLRHYIALMTQCNPFLCGGTVFVESIAQLIWAVSVDYKPNAAAQMKWFKKSGLIEPRPPLLNSGLLWARYEAKMKAHEDFQILVVGECKRYAKETLQDIPPRRANVFAASKSYYSEACFWCAMMGREYGTPINDVLSMPLKQLFQFLNEIKDRNGKTAAMRNPSDDVIAEWWAERRQ